MSGWIKLHRKLTDNPLWHQEPFTRGQAWVDLILLANHTDGFIRARGVRVDLKRGQCGWCEVALAKRWGWSRGKTKRFISELETDQQVVQQKNNVTSVISISNYDMYQLDSTASDTADGQQTGQQTDSKQDTNKNVKKNKNEKEDTPKTPKGARLHDLSVNAIEWPDTCNQEIKEAFLMFLAERRAKGKYVTANAIKGLFGKLKGFSEEEQLTAINDAIAGSYAGLFPKTAYAGKSSTPVQNLTKLPTQEEYEAQDDVRQDENGRDIFPWDPDYEKYK